MSNPANTSALSVGQKEENVNIQSENGQQQVFVSPTKYQSRPAQINHRSRSPKQNSRYEIRESELSKCDENVQRPSDLVPLVPDEINVQQFEEHEREYQMYVDDVEEEQQIIQGDQNTENDETRAIRYRQRKARAKAKVYDQANGLHL